MANNLIFDIGLHKGLDAAFYLRKGFNVVGVEAAQSLCDVVITEQAQAIADGRLVILRQALGERSGQTVSFFINPDKDDWGSLFRHAAEKGVGSAYEIKVETITLADLIAEYGVPYYIKCDIEGGDAMFVRQLHSSAARPEYISLELTDVEDLAYLLCSGYDSLQIVNQYLNPFTTPPRPSREGTYAETQFTHYSSGLFGRELPEARWTDYATTVGNFMDWNDLRLRDGNLGLGWLDVHARRSTAPDQ